MSNPIHVWEFTDLTNQETSVYFTFTSDVTLPSNQFVVDEGHTNYSVELDDVMDESEMDDLTQVLDPDFIL